MDTEQNNIETPSSSNYQQQPIYWLEPQAMGALKAISNWSTFLAITGLVFSALILLFGVGSIFGGAFLGSAANQLSSAFPLTMFGVLYTLMGALYFYPSLQALKLGKQLKAYLAAGNPQDAINGLFSLKNLFAFFGILTAILLGIYALVILAGLFSMALL